MKYGRKMADFYVCLLTKPLFSGIVLSTVNLMSSFSTSSEAKKHDVESALDRHFMQSESDAFLPDAQRIQFRSQHVEDKSVH